MSNNLVITNEIVIKAPAAGVWDALVNPAMVKQYLFGTNVVTDWKVGSPIVWQGEWQGKTYEDKGVVLQNVPEKVLETTYWSSMSGKPDAPENYIKVKYELMPVADGTKLTITQTNNEADKSDHSGDNWKMVLSTIKKIVEN